MARRHNPISPDVLDSFRSLIDRPLKEEEYQEFLANTAVLLDPLASAVLPKHRFGAEFVADYVVPSLADRHTIVEIEPRRIGYSLKAGDFSARLTHALGQVLDSQEWVETNIEYARTSLPGIVSPIGLVVIGRSIRLSDREKAKLRRFNVALGGRVRIATI